MPIKFADKYIDKYSGLTHVEVRRLFDYEPETGFLICKVQRRRSKRQVGEIVGYKYIDKRGYRKIRIEINEIRYSVHRLIWFWVTGDWPKDEIDHKDRNGWNNKWENLRSATRLENGKNLSLTKRNTTGVTGVTWDAGRKKYLAVIFTNHKTIHLGRFSLLEQAALARRIAEERYFGEFARK